MDDLASQLAPAGRQVLAHLPVERGLERVFHRQRAAVYEEQVGHVGRLRHAGERLDELGHVGGVDVRIGRLVQRHLADALQEAGRAHLRVVVADRLAGEVGVEVEILAARCFIAQVRPVGPLEIHHQVFAVGQHVAADGVQHVLGRNDGVGSGIL